MLEPGTDEYLTLHRVGDRLPFTKPAATFAPHKRALATTDDQAEPKEEPEVIETATAEL